MAQAAGVSKGTVSRVLNNSPRVSPAARQAVERAIAATGYRTNAHARSLATGRAGAIALLVARPGNQVFSDPTFAKLIAGVQEGMTDSHLGMVMLLGGTKAEDSRTLSYLMAGHVDGLIHLNPISGDPILEGLCNNSLPMVLCGEPPAASPPRSWIVTIDDAAGIRQALQHLEYRGAQRTGFIAGPDELTSAQLRLEAFHTWQGDGFDPSLVAYGDFGTESGYEAARKLLCRDSSIDALLCASDRMAVGALKAAKEVGRHVPHDLLVVGFDGHTIGERCHPTLTTVAQPFQQVGRLAVETLLAGIHGDDPADIVLPTELVVRESA